MTLDPEMPKGRYVLTMASILRWEPSRVGRKIGDLYKVLTLPAQRRRKSLQVHPFEVWLIEISYRVIKIETINVAGDSHGADPHSKKAGSKSRPVRQDVPAGGKDLEYVV
jgi:hypothetical protein